MEIDPLPLITAGRRVPPPRAWPYVPKWGLLGMLIGAAAGAGAIALYHRPRRMRGRVPYVKMLASAITIGSGGSGGTEGPAAQISAAFGSVLSDRGW